MINYKNALTDLNNLKPGEKVVYYTGHIAEAVHKHRDLQAEELRKTAWLLRLQDKAILVQQKISNGVYLYMAIGADPNRTKKKQTQSQTWIIMNSPHEKVHDKSPAEKALKRYVNA